MKNKIISILVICALLGLLWYMTWNGTLREMRAVLHDDIQQTTIYEK